jgi:GNAT superfamily N-acetyltransferase
VSRVAPRIRPVEPRDGPALIRLAEALGYPSTAEQIRARLARIAADPEHAVFVAENSDGQVIGWVHVFISKLLESDPRAEIGGLVADPAVRRQGVGRALMQHAEAWSCARGLKVVSLRTNIKRADAHHFYESLGYAPAKTQHNYRKQL